MRFEFPDRQRIATGIAVNPFRVSLSVDIATEIAVIRIAAISNDYRYEVGCEITSGWGISGSYPHLVAILCEEAEASCDERAY